MTLLISPNTITLWPPDSCPIPRRSRTRAAPDLGDPARYIRVDRIPIVDILERKVVKYDDNGHPHRVTEQVDEDQLRRILHNSRLRAKRGEFGIVFLGHTDDDGPELDQPPVVGYLSDYEEGIHEGVPTILASMYIDKEACSDIVLHGKQLNPSAVPRQFPRRSAEIMGIESPHAFIDSVGLLKRTPERMLGYVSSLSHLSNRCSVTCFDCPDCAEKGGRDMPATRGKRPVNPKDVRRTLAKRALGLIDALVQHAIDGEEEGMPVDDELPPEEFDEGPPDDEEELPPLGDEPEQEAEHNQEEAYLEGEDEGMEEMEGEPPMEDEESMEGEEEEPEQLCAACNGTGRAPHGVHGRPERMEHEQEHEPRPRRPRRFATQSPAEGDVESMRLEAGMAGPYTAIPKTEGDEGGRMRKPPKPKPTGTPQSLPPAARMRQDSERIGMSRFQKIVDGQAKEIEALKARLNSADQRAEQATVEQQVIQLEAEGYILDRPTEVARLSAMAPEARASEITRMRKYQSRSPVAQVPIPNFWGDTGGNTLPRQPTAQQTMELSAEDQSYGVRGWTAARFARSLETDAEYQRTEGLDRGMAAISRMRAAATDN